MSDICHEIVQLMTNSEWCATLDYQYVAIEQKYNGHKFMVRLRARYNMSELVEFTSMSDSHWWFTLEDVVYMRKSEDNEDEMDSKEH